MIILKAPKRMLAIKAALKNRNDNNKMKEREKNK